MVHCNPETIYVLYSKKIYEKPDRYFPERYSMLVESPAGRNRKSYYNIPCAFDIETTTINCLGGKTLERPIGFMYSWQFAIRRNDGYKAYTAIRGRRWEEFIELLIFLKKYLGLKDKVILPIYSHAAFFEFQFLRNFIDVTDLFARNKREPIRVSFNHGYELRCSYYLSNMSLSKCIEITNGAIFGKLSGDTFDYSKKRTPSTTLSLYEVKYSYNDVLGLCEYLDMLLKDDNMLTIPMTSTGFVRREVRDCVLQNPDNQKNMIASKLSPRLYVLCKTASRGGNSTSNPYLVDTLLNNVKGADLKSSYPAVMMMCPFPITSFCEIRPTVSNLQSYQDKAMLIDCTLYNLKISNPMTLCYIPSSRCTRIVGNNDIDKGPITYRVANGRIVEAESASMVITDVDLRIISQQYTFDIEINSLHISDYGKLNNEFRMSLLDMFVLKTKLERGDPELYVKIKNKINAYFGMMLTDICAKDIYYRNGKWSNEKTIDIESKLNRYYASRKSFLSYQHGIWVTAWARYRHMEGITACGSDIVMGDTDSCKYINDHEKDFDELNAKWITQCYNNDIVPIIKVWEKPTILGIWEHEETYSEYKTLGSKKHAYRYAKNNKLGITVAGLNKKKGAKWLELNGGLDAFSIGKTIPEKFAGRTTAYYNDVDAPYQLTIDGCTFTTASNIGVVDATYTIGVSDDYWQYLVGIGIEADTILNIEESIIQEENEYENIYSGYTKLD